MHLSFCYLRWRQHPERVASIKSMNASELSRRRLKVNTSDPLPPADHMMEDARQDEMSDDAEESHEVPPSAIPEHLNEDIEESDEASHSEAKGDGGDRETTECDTLDYTMAKAEKVTDDENDGSEIDGSEIDGSQIDGLDIDGNEIHVNEKNNEDDNDNEDGGESFYSGTTFGQGDELP